MDLDELIYKAFRDSSIIWSDYIDYIKTNDGLERKGLKQVKRFGRYEIYLVSEDGDEILLDALQKGDEYKFENILKAFLQ